MVSLTSATATAIFAMVLFIGESQAAVPLLIKKLTGGKRSIVEMRSEAPLFTRDVKSELGNCLKLLKTHQPQPTVKKLSNDKVTINGLPAKCITDLTKYKNNPANKAKIQGEIIISGTSVTLNAKSNAELVDGLDGDQPAAAATSAGLPAATKKPSPKPKGNAQV